MFFLPSRSRPDKIEAFIAAYRSTGATAPVCVRIDDDDPERAAYEAIDYPASFRLVTGKRPEGGGSAALITEFYESNPDLPWYGLMADDVIPISHEWDRKLIEAAGNCRIAWGPDGLINKACSTHPVIGGDLVREIGWLALPGVRHYFVDLALFQMAQRAGLVTYVEDAEVKHAPVVQQTRSAWALDDRIAFNAFQRGPMQDLVNRLRKRFPCDDGVRCLSFVSVVSPERQCHLEWTLGLMRLRELCAMESIGHQFMFFLGPVEREKLIDEVMDRSTSSHVAFLDTRAGFDAEALVRDTLAGKWSDTLLPVEALRRMN